MAARFTHELALENDDKIDFKVKAKQFVKIYGQMASILPFEIVAWEKLFWFLKFLIPSLTVADPDSELLDELLESVDLSSYGLERVKLGHSIELEDEETELDPQNPNPRSAHGTEKETDPLEVIVNTFNERWFQGWGATPEEQRVKFVNLLESVAAHPDYKDKYQDNADPHNRELAFDKIFKEVMLKHRKKELEFYRLFVGDEAFSASLKQSVQRLLEERTYLIKDNFLNFWFRFIYRNNSAIGNHWERGNKNEIDIVVVNDLDKAVLVGEVKMNPARASIPKLKEKAVKLEQHYSKHRFEYQVFGLDDIDRF